MVSKETIDFIKSLGSDPKTVDDIIGCTERAKLVENVRQTQIPYQLPLPTYVPRSPEE